MKNSKPIGIFDSGLGGLTVIRSIITHLPHENIIYIGDTARVPYGTRSKKIITQFAKELVGFLLKKEVKILVVACNTISATCINTIKSISSVPVLDVIEPTVLEAIQKTNNKKVGVIGTRATIDSGIYKKMILHLLKKSHVFSTACPLFVPFAEEGLVNHPATYEIAKEYLHSFKKTGIDTLILGCTHYPLLKSVIQKSVGENVKIIDSAEPTVLALKKTLQEKNLLNKSKDFGKKEYYFTDVKEGERKVIKLFLGSYHQKEIREAML